MRLALLLISLPLAAQSINCGGPAVGTYVADQLFSGGAVWTAANDPAMGMQTGPYQTLRYGTSFSYTIPVPTPGMTAVSVLLMEPNKTGPGQRLFTITVNGHTSAPLDLFALTGGKLIPYEYDTALFVAQSQVTISFNAIVGNAVVSAIVMLPQPTQTGALTSGWVIWAENWIGLFYRDTDGSLNVVDPSHKVTALSPVPIASATSELDQYTAALAWAKAQGPPH